MHLMYMDSYWDMFVTPSHAISNIIARGTNVVSKVKAIEHQEWVVHMVRPVLRAKMTLSRQMCPFEVVTFGSSN